MNAFEQSAAPSPKKVYVVDDDSMVRQALFFSLSTAGYGVRSFASGRDLLDEIDHLAPGCILLDVRMPDMDGAEVLSALGDRLPRFPVIMITGHGDIDIAVRTMKLGAKDFLEKPFSDDALLELLEPLFGSLPAQVEAEQKQARARDVIAKLTPRERDVLECIVAGLSNKQAALKLEISPRTVEVHRANLMRDLDANSVGEAVRIALLAGVKTGSAD